MRLRLMDRMKSDNSWLGAEMIGAQLTQLQVVDALVDAVDAHLMAVERVSRWHGQVSSRVLPMTAVPTLRVNCIFSRSRFGVANVHAPLVDSWQFKHSLCSVRSPAGN